jgi:hypothetical protein
MKLSVLSVTIAGLALVAACEKKAPEAPVATVAAPPAPPAPPATAELKRLSDIGSTLNATEVWDVNSYVLPTKPGLELSGAPEGEMQRIHAKLKDIRPLLDESISLIATITSRRDDPRSVEPQESVSAICTPLIVEAARCWDDDDASASFDRLLAALRLGRWWMSPGELGRSMNPQRAMLRLQAQCDAGLSARLTLIQREALLTELNAFDATDPFGMIALWKNSAEQSLKAAKENYVGKDAGKKLAADIEQYGALTDDFALPGISKEMAEAFKGGIVLKSGAEKAKTLSAATIARHVKDAEPLIAAVHEALLLPDPAPRLMEIQATIAADPSQVARLVIGAPAATYLTNRNQIEQLKRLRECFAGTN